MYYLVAIISPVWYVHLAFLCMYVCMCSTKSDCSPVTVADFCVQAMVLSNLRACFPSDRFIAEEDSQLLRTDVCMYDKCFEILQVCVYFLEKKFV